MFNSNDDYEEELRRREFYHPYLRNSFEGLYSLPSIASMIRSSTTSGDDVIVCNSLRYTYYLNVVLCWADSLT
jgi:hypothetical protein